MHRIAARDGQEGLIWCIWFVLFTWLASFNQRNQTDQTNESNKPFLALHAPRSVALADLFGILLMLIRIHATTDTPDLDAVGPIDEDCTAA